MSRSLLTMVGDLYVRGFMAWLHNGILLLITRQLCVVHS
jgi:hypothetical protein